jgi:hypothetical protein
MAAYSSVNV